MAKLEHYVLGQWQSGHCAGMPLLSAVDGAAVASITSDGLNFGEVLGYARDVGGKALRKYTFHERALMLKAVAQHLNDKKADLYKLSTETGATRKDSWIDIDGGIATMFVYSSKGRREMPNSTVYLDGPPE
ncbi:MAG: hypothetical protein WBN23_13610, partial [Woeseia sp.]